MITSDILYLLLCPDCSGGLIKVARKITCEKCKRIFYSDGNFIDLLPTKPLTILNPYSKKAVTYYHAQYKLPSDKNFKNFKVWGVYDNSTRDYKVFLNQERKIFEKYYSQKKKVFCDLSAASGYYTMRASHDFEIVLHLDINLEYLKYAQKKAKKKDLTNLFFIRADYFNLPIKNEVVDTMICTDSFEYYGLKNDIKIVKKAYKKISKGGRFIFDLHNKKFYYPDKYIFEYGRPEIEILKKELSGIEILSFGRVPTLFHPNNFLFNLFSILSFLPAIRYIAIVRK